MHFPDELLKNMYQSQFKLADLLDIKSRNFFNAEEIACSIEIILNVYGYLDFSFHAVIFQVFLQATPLNSQGASQQKVIARLR